MVITLPPILGRRSVLDKQRTPLLIFFATLFCLIFHQDACGLEERKGVIQRTTDPVCNFGCGSFYLDPDPSYGFIYLRGYDFFPYLGIHVQVIGTKGTCGGCSVLDVVNVIPLPPVGVEQHEDVIPRELTLSQNYPNPFNPLTKIVYAIPHAEYVSLTVHNVLGQTIVELVNGAEQFGAHTVIWDADNVPGGVYYYRLQTAEGTIVKRMVLVR